MALFRPVPKHSRGLRAFFDTFAPRRVADGPRFTPAVAGMRETPATHGSKPDGALLRANAKLSELKPGESGTVSKLLGNAQGRLRLMEMGLTPGAQVKVMHMAAFGGPMQITVRGYQLSLRRDEASAIVLS